MLSGKTILLGVCGGIAAYKAAALCSKLTQAGARVRVIMTEGAAKMVQPLTFQVLSKNHVMVDTFDEIDPSVVTHIEAADQADLVIIAPATANMLAKLAYGLADDMLSTTMLVVRAPVLIAPAMNVHMYNHPTVQSNLQILRSRGHHFIEPGEGQLACGYVGKGRLAEPEEIVAAADKLLEGMKGLESGESDIRTTATEGGASGESPALLAGKKVLVTAGGTIERIDPVRYLTNDSSGKMGFAIAEAARRLGAEVTLVAARTSAEPPSGIQVVKAMSALEMYDTVLELLPDMDLIVKAAAVADYRPVDIAEQKIKKNGDELTLQLVKNPDILQEVGRRKTTQFVIGFAAETENVEQHARAKLVRKNCDLIAANDVSETGAGFGTDTNRITVYGPEEYKEQLPFGTKAELAEALLRIAASRMELQVGRHKGGAAG